jgi:hypothetical protein
MPSHLASPWNHAVTFLEMLFGELVLSTGTGFFWREEGRTYLITNWHNLAGRRPDTLDPLSSHGGTPDRIRFMVYKKTSEQDGKGFFKMKLMQPTIALNEQNETPLWKEHGQHGRRIDIATIDVTEAVNSLLVRHANEVEADAVLAPYTSQDVFVLGFPLGMITGVPAPVWKRASVASDPNFDPDGLPKIFIDTATRPGMSGSVVLARHRIFGKKIPRKDGTESERMMYAQFDTVLGVYSGRLGAGDLEAQLGIVWRRNAIVETILQGRTATLA